MCAPAAENEAHYRNSGAMAFAIAWVVLRDGWDTILPMPRGLIASEPNAAFSELFARINARLFEDAHANCSWVKLSAQVLVAVISKIMNTAVGT